MANLNGIIPRREKGTIFIALPPEMWMKPAGVNIPCSCPTCFVDAATTAYYDTLAVSSEGREKDFTWMVHYPEMHPPVIRRAKQAGEFVSYNDPCPVAQKMAPPSPQIA